MNYWLLKSEPTTYSIDDLANADNQTTYWEGVRNYQARNMIRDDMHIGDQGFFYHSSCKIPGIVGIVEITSESYPDPTQFDPESSYYDPKSTQNQPRWFVVDVKLVKKLPSTISLKELKSLKNLKDMALLQKGNRLSVMPVAHQQWETILKNCSQ